MLRAIGRHRGRSHPGGFDPHDGGFGGGRWRSGRKLGADELQLVLLALLADAPAHGYELIRRLQEMSGGFYAPSPGMIYPALTYLEEIGHAVVEPDGARKLYRLSDAGRAHLEAHRDEAAAMIAALRRIGARMDGVRDAFAGLDDPDPRAADELHRARHALKRALFAARGASSAERLRIVRILDRATEEILRGEDRHDAKGQQDA